LFSVTTLNESITKTRLANRQLQPLILETNTKIIITFVSTEYPKNSLLHAKYRTMKLKKLHFLVCANPFKHEHQHIHTYVLHQHINTCTTSEIK